MTSTLGRVGGFLAVLAVVFVVALLLGRAVGPLTAGETPAERPTPTTSASPEQGGMGHD